MDRLEGKGALITRGSSGIGLETARQFVAKGATSQSLQNQIPAGRFGKPGEIASTVAFLASDESAFTVGSELIVDGGLGL